MLKDEPSSSSKKVVLIVDDEESICDALAFELDDAGYVTRTAFSGLAAIDILKNETIDLVITDFRMQHGSGLDVLNFVRQRHNSHPAVLILSGDNDQKFKELYNLGLDGILSKPYRSQDLLSAISSKLTPIEERLLGDLQQAQELPELILQCSDIWDQTSDLFRIGRGGFSSTTTLRRLRLGTHVGFEVTEKNSPHTRLRGIGTVKWIANQDGVDRIGLEFNQLDRNSLDLFKDFLSRNNPKTYIPA